MRSYGRLATVRDCIFRKLLLSFYDLMLRLNVVLSFFVWWIPFFLCNKLFREINMNLAMMPWQKTYYERLCSSWLILCLNPTRVKAHHPILASNRSVSIDLHNLMRTLITMKLSITRKLMSFLMSCEIATLGKSFIASYLKPWNRSLRLTWVVTNIRFLTSVSPEMSFKVKV